MTKSLDPFPYGPKTLPDSCPERNRVGAWGPTDRSMRNAACRSRERAQRRPLKMITMAWWALCFGALTPPVVVVQYAAQSLASMDRSVRVCRNRWRDFIRAHMEVLTGPTLPPGNCAVQRTTRWLTAILRGPSSMNTGSDHYFDRTGLSVPLGRRNANPCTPAPS
jgi:hypothetical protein